MRGTGSTAPTSNRIEFAGMGALHTFQVMLCKDKTPYTQWFREETCERLSVCSEC